MSMSVFSAVPEPRWSRKKSGRFCRAVSGNGTPVTCHRISHRNRRRMAVRFARGGSGSSGRRRGRVAESVSERHLFAVTSGRLQHSCHGRVDGKTAVSVMPVFVQDAPGSDPVPVCGCRVVPVARTLSEYSRHSGGPSTLCKGICRRPAPVPDVSAMKILHSPDWHLGRTF